LPLRHAALAILVAFILGVSFVAVRLAVDEWPPLLVTGWRFLLAAFPLVFFVRRPAVPARLVIAYGFMQGVVMFGLGFTAIAWGMPAGLASLIFQAQVVFTIAFAAILLGERPQPQHVAGGLIAIAGMVLIGWSKLEGAGGTLLPFMMVIGAAASWGVANIISKVARPPDMPAFVIWSALAAPVPLFLMSMMFEGTSFGWAGFMPSITAISAIAFMAYGATVLAFSIWTWLLRTYSAATVTPFALLIPVFGFGSMALTYGERLSAMTWLGAVIVFAGLAVNVFGARMLPAAFATVRTKE
jgi:O-acetylserine/cysteine efflux transporter